MSRTLWEEGREPGRAMVTLGLALTLTTACLDLAITGGLSILFDLCFVALCLGMALAVRPRDFFTVGVLPPLLMLVTVLVLALSRSSAVGSPHDGLLQSLVTGLSHHSITLFLGYLGCLLVLHVRRRVSATRSGPGRRLPA